MKILLVLNQLLFPADTGGKIRSSQLFRRLSRQHDIVALSLVRSTDTDAQIAAMGQVCRRLDVVPWREADKASARFYLELAGSLASPVPFIVSKYLSPQLRARVRELLAEERPDLLLCDFLQPSINVVDLPFAPKVLFQHNVEAQIRRRHCEQERNPLAKAYLWLQWRRLRRYEGFAMRHFDHVVTVSEADSATMLADYGVAHTTPVPLGVDTDEFAPSDQPPVPGRLVFTGSMDWLPNEDAMVWFVGEVLPLIRARRPDASLAIVGRKPTAKVQALAGDGVVVTGTVPDVQPLMAEGQVYIVPLRVGGGTRIKIFEAMAMGCPIVSTTLGAEGLPVSDGEDLLLADEPTAFAQAVLGLLDDPARRQALGTAARRKMVEHYSWDSAAEVFGDICARTVSACGRSADQQQMGTQ